MTILRESIDLVQERRNALKKLFPNAFTEDKLDFEKIQEMLDKPTKVSSERYSFSWAGKADSIRTRDTTSKLTIIPSKNDSINFEETKNIIIEGENLEVLKILQKSYAGKVKMIYIDPPYNTGKDFIYKDDFKEPLKSYLKYTGQVDEAGSKTSTLTEVSGRYHSNWLSMMYPRLSLARSLLSEDGVIFVSIDDNENFNLRLILNEIFGEENFVSTISWKTRSTGGQVQQGSLISQIEYIIIFAKDKSNLCLNKIANVANVSKAKWRDFRKAGGQWQRKYRPHQFYPFYYDMKQDLLSLEPHNSNDIVIFPRDSNDIEGFWENGKETAKDRLLKGELKPTKTKNGRWKILQLIKTPKKTKNVGTFLDIPSVQGVNEAKAIGIPFDNPKPSELIKTLIKLGSDEDDIVFDFFAGSGTTGQAVLEINKETNSNRQFILVQLPEPISADSEQNKSGFKNISDICTERIRRVIAKIMENSEHQALDEKSPIDLGFKKFLLSKSVCSIWDPENIKDYDSLVKYIEKDASVNSATAFSLNSENLIFELILHEGFRLDCNISNFSQGKNSFWKVSDGAHLLLMCFDENIDLDSVSALSLTKDDKLIVLDSSLTDTQKVNLTRMFRVETV